MDSFEINKILGALLGAVFIVFSVGLIAENVFYAPTPATPGYHIEVPEQVAADAEDVDEGPNVVDLIADADVAAGEAAFRRCVSCHTVEEGGPNRVGPNLWDVVERPVAAMDGFNYSAAMREFAEDGTVWTYEHLSGFLANPRGYIPGTTMAFAGIRDIQEEANLIAYMRSLSDDPAPLPEPVAVEEEAPVEEEVETEAEPVEPSPEDDGTAVGPEPDAGVPAVEDEDGAALDEEAEVDLAAGESLFRRCVACHTIEQGGPNRVGPNLWDVADGPVAAVEGFNYSPALREFAEDVTVWDDENLHAYIENPRGHVPGTTMAFAGLRDAEDRSNLIAYIRSFSE